MAEMKQQHKGKLKKFPNLPTTPSSLNLEDIEVISFDVDDTLWDCLPVIHKAEAAMLHFLQENGHDAICEELKYPQLGKHSQDVRSEFPHRAHEVTFVRHLVIQRVCQIHLQEIKSPDEISSYAQQVFDIFYQKRTEFVSEHFFRGSVEALQRLKLLGLRIGTISNGNAQVMKVPELQLAVEHHVSPDASGVLAKPHREPFDKFRELFSNVEPHRVLHVGDSLESDVVGALQAGMHSCWVTKSTQCDHENVLLIRRVSQLADLFEDHFQRKNFESAPNAMKPQEAEEERNV